MTAVRPMEPGDVPAAWAAAWAALAPLFGEAALLEPAAARARRGERRTAHLLATDPGGCWVAEREGEIVGTALGLVRDGLWGFSLFGVHPDHHGHRIGTELFAAALTHAQDTRGQVILSSAHPAAMRRYARAGFALHPAMSLSGAWDPQRLPTGLRARPGDPDADRATLDAASAHVRGASHARDVPVMLETPGARLLVLEGEGFAVVGPDGSPSLLAATDEAAARDLLWSALASGPRGGTVSFDFVTAANQWAIEVGLEAGLALTPEGPVFVRGEVGPLAPYLPSGAYL